jgi:hypothetical protein
MDALFYPSTTLDYISKRAQSRLQLWQQQCTDPTTKCARISLICMPGGKSTETVIAVHIAP